MTSVYHVFAKPVAASPQDARLLTEIQQQQIDESYCSIENNRIAGNKNNRITATTKFQ
jgi:hypothetical protein